MEASNVEFHSSSIAETLNEKFEALFPTWPTIVATVLAVIILVTVLTKLFYKPIKKMVAERKKFIQSNIDNAIKQNEAALNDRKIALEKVAEANKIAKGIVAEAKIRAEKIMKTSIENAKDEANRLMQSAHKEAIRDKELFEAQAKEEMVSLALAAAKQVIKKEVNVASNRKLVRDFIKENAMSENRYDS